MFLDKFMTSDAYEEVRSYPIDFIVLSYFCNAQSKSLHHCPISESRMSIECPFNYRCGRSTRAIGICSL